MKALGPTLSLVCLFAVRLVGQDTPKPESMESAVAKVLSQNCLECHSGPKPAENFDLSQPDLAARGPDLNGDPTTSDFWQKVSSGEMPPETELPDEDRQILERWIMAGAPWKIGAIDPLELTTAKRAGRDWWSLQPIEQPAIPAVDASHRVRNPVDAFLLAELERHHLSYSAPARPRALVRRLYFDLTGLPPPPEAIQAFEQDPSEAAYAAIVDRLLDSPEYGERWARHWLDVVRYGESDGFERNAPREHMWHYRDWVIQAFNDDMPFDEFARRQLAGDWLTSDPLKGMAATGYLVAGVHNTVVGSSKTMQLLARQDELEDLVGSVGQTFLGLTLNCARCHDHKFDPITQQEYYQLVATFAGVNHGLKQTRARRDQREIDRLTIRRESVQNELRQLELPARESILAKRNQNRGVPQSLAEPILRWSFDRGPSDEVRSLVATLQGNARLESDGLVLDGVGDYAITDPLPLDLREKTLEVWLSLNDLNQQGGAAISIETSDGSVFDAVVFGEREPQMWMAGSNGFVRTQSLGGAQETSSPEDVVHVALTYSSAGTISCYRNGELYGAPYQTSEPPVYASGSSRILFGLRHSPAGGNKFFGGKLLRAQVYDRVLTPGEIADSFHTGGAFVGESELIAGLDQAALAKRQRLIVELQATSERLRKIERESLVSVYTHTSNRPEPTYFLPRGDVSQPAEEVSPGTTRAIAAVDSDFRLNNESADGPRRLALAHWVTDSNNPLVRRVIVNRLWQYHFGRGLVANASDFGFNGGMPTHPHLLEWLSCELERQQYRLKPMHRLLVTSNAYRQSSELNSRAWTIDADNRLLWRKAPTRLEAEIIRDSMLAIAGKLNPQRGGPSFRDVAIIDQNNGTTYYTEIDQEDPQLNRRTIYRFSPRGGRSALLDTLDCPDPSTAAPRRSVTTTPLQALSLLNSPFVLRMSDAFATRVETRFPQDARSQIEWMFQLVYSRAPAAEEFEGARRLLDKHGVAALARALFNSSEFVIAP